MKILPFPLSILLFAALCVVRAQSPPPSTAYAEAISADALIGAFRKNPIAANGKYLGHRMSVGGVVEKVGMKKGNVPFVILRPQNRQASGSIKCRFAPDLAPRIGRLRRNSPTDIKSTVVSSGQGKVGLKDCSL